MIFTVFKEERLSHFSLSKQMHRSYPLEWEKHHLNLILGSIYFTFPLASPYFKVQYGCFQGKWVAVVEFFQFLMVKTLHSDDICCIKRGTPEEQITLKLETHLVFLKRSKLLNWTHLSKRQNYSFAKVCVPVNQEILKLSQHVFRLWLLSLF